MKIEHQMGGGRYKNNMSIKWISMNIILLKSKWLIFMIPDDNPVYVV